jgi:LysM repeat protein
MATISIAAPAARRMPRSASTGAAAPRPVAGSDAVPLRLTRRGRRLARTAIVLLAVLAALLLSVASRQTPVQAGTGPATSATTTVVVQPGQTLWTVARSLSPDADARETVARIQELNGLTGSSVRPGQSLIVPVIG